MTGPAAADERQMPEKFGRYLLTDRIGSGGMAEVFRAVTFGSEGFRRIIVVKRIRRELSESANFLQMFFAEAKISALLHHQNIVQVYDFGQVNGWYFLAMEYLEGKDVATILRALRPARRAIPPSLAAHVGREVVAGLQYVHKLRSADDRPLDIVHRDVSPANVMLLRTGRIKLLDFGIALASDLADESPAQRASLKGKLSYISPEQARCEPLDRRSDLFSWGATTWEMLTGVRLFGGKSDLERVTAVKQMPVPPPSTLRSAIPAALDRIVLRALARDRALRYQSADELAGDLTAFLKISPLPQDAVTRLLSELFGRDSASGTMPALPSLEGLVADGLIAAEELLQLEAQVQPADLGRSLAFPGDTDPRSSKQGGAGIRSALRRRSALWAMGAALVVTTIAVISFLLFARAPAPSTASTASPKGGINAGPVGANRAGPLPPGHVRIEVDSEPSGARVSGSRGFLGTTPLQVTLPMSSESEELRFEKPGFKSTTYEVRPERPGMIFVELKPVRR